MDSDALLNILRIPGVQAIIRTANNIHLMQFWCLCFLHQPFLLLDQTSRMDLPIRRFVDRRSKNRRVSHSFGSEDVLMNLG